MPYRAPTYTVRRDAEEEPRPHHYNGHNTTGILCASKNAQEHDGFSKLVDILRDRQPDLLPELFPHFDADAWQAHREARNGGPPATPSRAAAVSANVRRRSPAVARLEAMVTEWIARRGDGIRHH